MTGATQGVSTRDLLARCQFLLEALPRAVIVVDLDARIVGWNERAQALYGWSRDEATGCSLYELITPPELRDAGALIMSDVLRGAAWDGDIRIVRRDGTRRTTFSYLGPLRDDDGCIIGALGAADDVTDVRQLERRAADLADHLVLALEAGRLGTWRWNLAADTTTWDVTMFRLFGLDPVPSGHATNRWLSHVHPDDAARMGAVFDAAVEQKSAYEVEHRIVWPDGSTHWIEARGKVDLDESGEVQGTIGCAVDITERKMAEETSARRAADAERLAQSERLQRERLEFLVELNDVAAHASDHLDLMHRAASAAVPRLGDWCTLHFLPQPGAVHEVEVAHADPARVEWAMTLHERLPFDPDEPFGVAAVMRTGRTEFFREVDRYLADPAAMRIDIDVPQQTRDVLAALQVTSVITVPLRTTRGVVGAMQFVSAESGRRYDNDDVTLAEAAAGRIAGALDVAWLAEQQRRIATTLQAALLPATLPTIEGIGVAVRYWAAGAVSRVGGDFYDVFPIAGDAWAVVIGDVCGTGPEAAAITAVARHTIRAAATHGAPPVDVLHWVNEAVLREGAGRFCTLVYSTLEPLGEGSWRWTSIVGGHPLPVVVAPDGVASHVGTFGTLIGALDTIVVTPVERTLRRGSTLVLHTDGVNDVRPPHDLDDEALEALFARAVAESRVDVADGAAPSVDAEAVAERIGAAVAAILPIPERDDDVAIIVLHVT